LTFQQSGGYVERASSLRDCWKESCTAGWTAIGVEFHSAHPYEGTVLEYAFSGTVQGESMNGTVQLGEYGNARWEARRVV
jgi:hypothetical protein